MSAILSANNDMTDILATLSDGSVGITESRLSDLAGIKRPRRAGWARQGLLRKRRRYDALDVVELFVFVHLIDELGYDDAMAAWPVVRPGLADQSPLLVFDWQRKLASLCSSPGEIGPLLLHGRLSRVLDLALVVAEARKAFEQVSGAGGRRPSPR